MTVRMRHTRGHTNNRRSQIKLAKPAISKDGEGNTHIRHRVSMATGSYRGRKVVDLNAKLERKAKKISDKTTAK